MSTCLIPRDRVPWRQLFGEDLVSGQCQTVVCIRDLNVFITVPCAPILRRRPVPSALESAELHPDFFFSKLIMIFQEKDAIMTLTKSKSTAYIFLSGASAYVCAHSSVLCLQTSNRGVRDQRRSSVGFRRETNVYLVVGYYEYFCCTTLSFTPSDTW